MLEPSMKPATAAALDDPQIHDVFVDNDFNQPPNSSDAAT